MEHLLLSNLAANQAFDQAARTGNAFDRVTSKYLQSVMYQPSQAKRQKPLEELQDDIVRVFGNEVAPAARAQGVANARGVLQSLGPLPSDGLNDPALRRRILNEGTSRPADRLRIFQAAVNDQANTLDNRLTAYWLEPGTSPNQKLAELHALHAADEERRKKYEEKLRAWDANQSEKKPSPPKLDFMSDLTQKVKGKAVEQARRSGTDAEIATFSKAGEKEFAWITVNAVNGGACPQCVQRNGEIGDLPYWDQRGRPGSGKTYCGGFCCCMLIPARFLRAFPGLRGGLNQAT